MDKPTNTVQPVAIPEDLPLSMILDKPALITGNLYYIAREDNIQGSWIKARLLEFTFNSPYYRLVELRQQKERVVDGRLLAYISASRSCLLVGTRIIAKFKKMSDSPEKVPKSDPYYAGVVAEQPTISNKYRYLIFFDIGYAQYVSHDGVNLVVASSPYVWDDVLGDTKPFIRKYLESQDTPMVELDLGQTIRVEYKSKWWTCIIKDIDCSLVQVYFEIIDRWEWIYRGSTRLSIMCRKEMAASTRNRVRVPRNLLPKGSGIVQYARNEAFAQPAGKENLPREPTRAVARQSTTTKPKTVKQPLLTSAQFLPNRCAPKVRAPTSKIMYLTPCDQQVIYREYVPHECGVQCKAYLTHDFANVKGYDPLSKPVLCGWIRITSKDGSKMQTIVYRTPCCRIIRSISEVHQYLRVTESEMTIDLFDFNPMVRCMVEFNANCTPNPKDLSNGIEEVPIPVINDFTNEVIDFVNYSNKRTPFEGVHMNLSEDFLCGCDCEDDCVDKLKCACWKISLEGIKYLGKDKDPTSVGYIYRRLYEQVITGIYECNSRCKCNSTCLNRVAQNPMSVKLQVFKTYNRGWGIRCLNDIPQGAFICCYTGTIHTESAANEDGMAYGDEYFAELDYIEIVEKFKEGYEEVALEGPEFAKEKTLPFPEELAKFHKGSTIKRRNAYMDDNDFIPPKTVSKPSAENGMKTRFRERKSYAVNKSQEEEAATKTMQEGMVKHAEATEEITDDIDIITISDDEEDDLPEEVENEAADAVNTLLPQKSRQKYENEYRAFQRWKIVKNVNGTSEKVLLAYFSEKSKKSKSSLWSHYSMLKATLLVKDNCDISKYSKLQLLKRATNGYKPKKSKVFEREDILRFLREASDDTYLFVKVAAIVELYGGCRSDELHKLQVCNVEDRGSVIIVLLVDTKTSKDRSFCITDKNDEVSVLQLIRKYMALRPNDVPHDKFFINYRLRKCIVQPVGITTFYKIPKTIAKFLNLENAENYTGHCFRRSSVTMLANAAVDLVTLKRLGGWKSSSVAETYIEESVSNKIAVSKQILVSTEANNSFHTNLATSSCSNFPEAGENGVPAINVSNNQDCTFNFYINSKGQG